MHVWRRIFETARWTPSPHNTQPWRVRLVDDRRAVVYVERSRTLPDEDLSGHFIRHAMSMFLAATEIAAGNAGFALRMELVDGAPEAGLREFARLELVDGGSPGEIRDDLILKRMTSRLPSDGRRIPPEITVMLQKLAEEAGHKYVQVDDGPLIEAIVRENIRAVFDDLNTTAYHDEIARWFRYSERESIAQRDGLDHRCMGLPGAELRVMRRFPGVMQWRLTRGFMRRIYRRQIGTVTHIGMLRGRFFENDAAMVAGKFLLRFWLELARRELYVHPFGNLVTNKEAHARLTRMTGVADVWLVFRIGHTETPPRSRRRTLEEVLVHD